MLTNIPIHTTALEPAEFIPANQDVETYLRKRNAELNAREEAVKRRELAFEARAADLPREEAVAERAAIDAERDAIAEYRETVRTTSEAMRKRWPTPQVFIVQIPTSIERDSVNSRLVQLGISQVSQEMMRATTIDELFNIDWTRRDAPLPHGMEPGVPGDKAFSEEVAERHAMFLDSVWQRQEAHDIALQRWQEQEIERVLDEHAGAPHRPRAENPPAIIHIRELSLQQLLIEFVMRNSQRLRNLAAEAGDFTRRNTLLMIRLHLLDVRGFEPTVPLERDRLTNALSDEAVVALREQVDDTSWNELVGFIEGLYRLDGGEVKNSDWPRGKASLPGGSPEPSDALADSAGNSTTSPITPAPDDESGRITVKSSGSTSAFEAEPGSSPVSYFQTGER